MKRKVLFILIGTVILIVLITTGRYINNLRNVNSNNFENSNINGLVSWAGVKNQGAGFKIKGEKKAFVFYPYFSLNENHNFTSLVKLGDSISKSEHSDTLFLFKDGNCFLFKFRRL